MFISTAYAQTTGASAQSAGSTVMLVLQFVLLGLVLYLFVLRPQQKKMKEHRALIDAVKKGDTVTTGGGLIGKVTKVEDAVVEIEIATNVRVRAVKASLSDVTPAGGTKPAND